MKDHDRRMKVVAVIRDHMDKILNGHDDHCGPYCRIDLQDHDCCYTCNIAQDMVAAYDRLRAEYGWPDALSDEPCLSILQKAKLGL